MGRCGEDGRCGYGDRLLPRVGDDSNDLTGRFAIADRGRLFRLRGQDGESDKGSGDLRPGADVFFKDCGWLFTSSVRPRRRRTNDLPGAPYSRDPV